MSKIIVLLPAYNEEASIGILLDKIRSVAEAAGWEYGVIACNDGSMDRTGEILAQRQASMPLEVITHKINRGLGETIRDLFERAAEVVDDRDVIIRLDCDDSHEPQHMADLVKKLDEGYDVVTASRFEPGGGQIGVSAYRAFISRCANIFLSIVFGFPNVKEYSCGYRAYRGEIVCRAISCFANGFIQLKGLGFTCTIEKLIKFHILGARFAEVPFVLRYDQKLSASKMVASTTTLGYLTLMVLYHWPWGGWRSEYRHLKRRPETLLDAAQPASARSPANP
jgi:dolichol-phosphate mannosyltransferase